MKATKIHPTIILSAILCYRSDDQTYWGVQLITIADWSSQSWPIWSSESIVIAYACACCMSFIFYIAIRYHFSYPLFLFFLSYIVSQTTTFSPTQPPHWFILSRLPATQHMDTEYTIDAGNTAWVMMCAALVFLMVQTHMTIMISSLYWHLLS